VIFIRGRSGGEASVFFELFLLLDTAFDPGTGFVFLRPSQSSVVFAPVTWSCHLGDQLGRTGLRRSPLCSHPFLVERLLPWKMILIDFGAFVDSLITASSWFVVMNVVNRCMLHVLAFQVLKISSSSVETTDTFVHSVIVPPGFLLSHLSKIQFLFGALAYLVPPSPPGWTLFTLRWFTGDPIYF